MRTIFDVQPDWCRARLSEKEITTKDNFRKKVLAFDPAEFYNNHGNDVKPFNRTQSSFSISLYFIFPSIPGECSCGCGTNLTGRRTRWASKDCSRFALSVYFILQGRTPIIYNYLSLYHGEKCSVCNNEDTLFVDHIHPVKLGGGGGWLSNYQLLCNTCHREKTNRDFGWKTKERQQITIL